MLSINIVPAKNGDCIWIREVNKTATFNLLIDGGTKQTYSDQLIKISKILTQQSEKFNLVIATHTDTDHIGGLTELLLNISDTEIGEIWNNGFLQVIPSKYYSLPQNENTRKDEQILNQIVPLGRWLS